MRNDVKMEWEGELGLQELEEESLELEQLFQRGPKAQKFKWIGIPEVELGRVGSQSETEAPKGAENCKQAWLTFLSQFPQDVREALSGLGSDAAVIVAIHHGVRDLARLTRLSFYAKYGKVRGFCSLQKGDTTNWDLEKLHVKSFLARPSPPLVQKGGIRCRKVELKIAIPRPDKPDLSVTGTYEHRYYSNPADKTEVIADYTFSINQAGRHIEGFLTKVLLPDAHVERRGSTEFHGDLQSDGRFLVYSHDYPEEIWGYLTSEPKGANRCLYWQQMAKYKNEPIGTKMGLVKISDSPTLATASAFVDQPRRPPTWLYDQERWPLSQAQIRHLVVSFAEGKIAFLLQTYFTTPADDRVVQKNALLDAAIPLHRYLEKVFTHKHYGIHLYDMFLGRHYARSILSRNKWKFKQVTRSQLDWIQIMLDVVTGYGFRLPNVTNYLGLKPTVVQGSKPVDPTALPNRYKVSISLKGLLVYYRGRLTIEKTTGKTWKETFKMSLKGFQVKPGFSLNEEGEAETYHDWLPADIPGSVELVTGKLGERVPGVKATAGGWFMHVFGSGYLPYLEVLGSEVNLGLNVSKKTTLDFVNLVGLWGEIYSKNLPDKDYSKFLPETDYTATYGLKDDVHFCLDSALLSEDARQALRIMCANELYALMSPDSRLTLYGHTDRSGPGPDYNLKLSNLRAQNTLQGIRDILGDKFRVPATQIICEGKGEADAKKDGRPAREVNPRYRRVDVILNARLVLTLKAL